ncbi:MAG: DUF2157 domain-containing protein [PVC group bacterium]
MRKKYIRWLIAELPDLMGRNILSPDAADRLREYYGGFGKEGKRTLAANAFSILAAILIGSGIILLLAHNWDELSREIRAVISFVPLVVAQVLAGWGIWRGKESRGWKEGISIFLMLAMGSSLALISQTYHLSNDPDTFTLTWMLLSIPLAYLVGGGAIIPLYLTGITVWTGMAHAFEGHPTFFWLLIALPLPYIWAISKKDPYRTGPVLLRACFTVSLIIGTAIILADVLGKYWVLIFSSMFAITYLVGRIWFDDAPPRVALQPLRSIGGAGVLVVALWASFRGSWEAIGRHPGLLFTISPEILLTLVLLIGSFGLLIICLVRFKGSGGLLGSLPLVALLGTVAARAGGAIGINIVLFTAYVFILGLTNLLAGIKEWSVGLINLGMVILCLLIVIRFFDSDLSFTVRGVAFIITGIGFLLTNGILLRKKQSK